MPKEKDKLKAIYMKYKSIEAKQAVDYIYGLSEKCYKCGLLNKPYPQEYIQEIIISIADELEFAKFNNLINK